MLQASLIDQVSSNQAASSGTAGSALARNERTRQFQDALQSSVDAAPAHDATSKSPSDLKPRVTDTSSKSAVSSVKPHRYHGAVKQSVAAATDDVDQTTDVAATSSSLPAKAQSNPQSASTNTVSPTSSAAAAQPDQAPPDPNQAASDQTQQTELTPAQILAAATTQPAGTQGTKDATTATDASKTAADDAATAATTDTGSSSGPADLSAGALAAQTLAAATTGVALSAISLAGALQPGTVKATVTASAKNADLLFSGTAGAAATAAGLTGLGTAATGQAPGNGGAFAGPAQASLQNGSRVNTETSGENQASNENASNGGSDPQNAAQTASSQQTGPQNQQAAQPQTASQAQTAASFLAQLQGQAASPAITAASFAAARHITDDTTAGNGASPTDSTATTGSPTALIGATSLQPGSTTTAASTTQTAYAPTATPLLPAEQVALAIGRLAGGGRSFTLQLNPEHLGSVEVRLDVDSRGKAKVSFNADKPETLALLKQDSPQLVKALQDIGISADSSALNFSLRDQGGNVGQDRRPSTSSGNRGGDASDLEAAVDDNHPAPVYLSNHLYDIRA